MSNATPSTRLQLKDGKTRLLRFTNDSLMALEDTTGASAVEHMQRVAKGSLLSLAALVWAGIRHAEPKQTIKSVGKLLDMTNLKPIGEAVGSALAEAYGAGDEDPDDEEFVDEDAEGKAPES